MRGTGSLPLGPHLYRIAQEAVHNAIRHGYAERITLRPSRDADGLRLVILDNGRGLPLGKVTHMGMGLNSMRYRAEAMGGSVRFEPIRPHGTRVICTRPLPEGVADPGGAMPRTTGKQRSP